MKINKIEGLISATFTPFFPDGTLNLGMIPELTDKLVADGLRGIFVCGSNGEGPNMTTLERMTIAEHFVKAANKRILVIVHVGHSSITEARVLAAHAERIGADAVSAVAAFYFKPNSVNNLANCMAQIAEAAPRLPFYYYHIPHLTGVLMDMLDFLQKAAKIIPNLAGIKYTASTIDEYQACLSFENGKYDILYGLDELLLPALSVGAKGAIGSTYTFAAPQYQKTIDYFLKGDMQKAQKCHGQMIQIIRTLLKYPPIPAQKAIMKMLGWDIGPSRLPLETLTPEDYNNFNRQLNTFPVFKELPAKSKI
jgi:N-acetylneuraminate lyase